MRNEKKEIRKQGDTEHSKYGVGLAGRISGLKNEKN